MSNAMAAWYKGEGNANDEFGVNNGSLIGGTTFTSGKVGQAFSFDGGGDGMRAPDHPALNSTTGTWAFWFRTAQTGINSGIVGRHVGSESLNGVTFFLRSDGRLEAFISGGAPGNNVASSNVVNDNTWHHTALTFAQGGQMVLYLDGQQVDTDVTPAFAFAANSPLSVGRMVNGFWSDFVGEVDEIEIFDQAISAAELSAIFDAGSLGTCPIAGTPTPTNTPTATPTSTPVNVPPTAGATAAAVTQAGQTSHAVLVTYVDDVAIDVNSITTGDIIVIGPGGAGSFAAVATMIGYDPPTNGSPIQAVYSFVPPGGNGICRTTVPTQW
ncbi:MAG: LamG domain-containing protein [Acidobacteria bacterium]|nr:LamG domain-containing protein [Acidobacteriota bacterium]